jgi:hypothetical protein
MGARLTTRAAQLRCERFERLEAPRDQRHAESAPRAFPRERRADAG